MKRNVKKALILALGLGLITGANTDTKAYADTEVRYVETKDELGRINWAISYLETSNKALDKAIEDAYKRIENSDPKTPTEEEKEILEKAKADREKSEIILAKLKSYKLKEEKPSDKDDETDKPSDGKTNPKEDDKDQETPEDKPSESEQTPPKEEDKPTDENKPSDKEEEKPEITKTTLKEEIPFETKRAVNDPNLETRIAQAGSNGFVEYELTYEGNKLIDKKVINKVEPTDQIIETYVKVKDAEIGTREVEDKSKPIYKTEYQQRAFAYGFPLKEYQETGEENPVYKEFDSYEEAIAYMDEYNIIGNYGTLNDYKEIKTLVGYETITEEYEISPAIYDWR
ncbi:hypothetical protein [Anaerococcus vaginimassiliensis]|uniref:hypothetical protein n=1 Tax=Anaerococcus vaginimassiliensis TaxID=2042308 RepID=UPI00102FF845|nr:hypothetical protein [Anaerococcus vaginimassiliensis]